jgi:hypothetical protein
MPDMDKILMDSPVVRDKAGALKPLLTASRVARDRFKQAESNVGRYDEIMRGTYDKNAQGRYTFKRGERLPYLEEWQS